MIKRMTVGKTLRIQSRSQPSIAVRRTIDHVHSCHFRILEEIHIVKAILQYSLIVDGR